MSRGSSQPVLPASCSRLNHSERKTAPLGRPVRRQEAEAEREVYPTQLRPVGTSRKAPSNAMIMKRNRRLRTRKLERVELFTWLETHGFARRNVDLFAGSRVTPNPRLPGLDVEDPEAPQLDAVLRC